MINIIIADDHEMIRDGIKNLLEFDGKMKIIAEASDGLECLELLQTYKPDVLLLDINMPNCNGLEVLEKLKSKKKKMKILMLTVHNETEYLMKAMEIGVNGYILKDSSSSELIAAINAILNGEEYIQPSLIPALNSSLINKDIDKEKINSLTKREIEVLILVTNGSFNRDIAEALNISERTVKNHMSNIFKKIGVVDRTQAAVFAIKNNLIKLF